MASGSAPPALKLPPKAWTVPRVALVPLAALFAFCMWFYASRILIPYQVSYAAAHQRPRGNLSDLYPRWLGARELWLHGRNPYGVDVTRDIQTGYYGRPLDPARPDDPGDQQAFAYPVYVTFLLVPTLRLPFETVRVGFSVLLAILTVASIFWWFRAQQWKPGWPILAATILLTLGSFPGIQGVKLQQLSLLVAALIAACGALLAGGHLFAAGVVLAVATIKPQLAGLLSAFLMLWTVSEWRTRQRFFWGFGITLALLCAGAQWLLPSWASDFWQALREYHRYTGGLSRLDVLLGPALGKVVALLVVATVAGICFRFRRPPATRWVFQLVLATVLAATLLVIPNFAPYNQLLLVPAILLVLRDPQAGWSGRAYRVAVIAAVSFLGWAWVAAFVLTVASVFYPAARVQQFWAAPLWSEFAIAPSFLLVLASLLARVWKSAPDGALLSPN